MLRALAFLGRHAGAMLAGGILIGIVLPPLAAAAAPLLVPSIVLLLVVALVRLEGRQVLALVRRPAAAGAVAAWALLVSPVLMTGVVSLLDPAPKLGMAMVLSAACPPIMSAIAFCFMVGLDAALATVVVFTAMFVVPLTLPPLALLLLGLKLDIDVLSFMARLGAITGGSLLLALAIHAVASRAAIERQKNLLDGIAVVGLLVFAVAIMDGVGRAALTRPGYVAATLAAAFAANAGLQLAGFAAFAWMLRKQALAVALLSGNRNMGLLLAALGAAADFDIVLYLALGQIPVFLTPLCEPIYRWASSRPRARSRGPASSLPSPDSGAPPAAPPPGAPPASS
jgi:BASS family bile acid:Na+ symporter